MSSHVMPSHMTVALKCVPRVMSAVTQPNNLSQESCHIHDIHVYIQVMSKSSDTKTYGKRESKSSHTNIYAKSGVK